MKYKSRFEGPWGDAKDLMIIHTGDWRFQRPVTKVGKCRQCGWCYIFCPTGCIEERETYFSANLDYCKGCGVCAEVCPADAIVMLPEED